MKYLHQPMLLLLATLMLLPAAQADDEIVVYSARKEHLIKPLFDAYTQKSGVKIRYITDKAGPLLARLKAEGANTPADLLITVDAGNLWQAAEQGVLSPIDSQSLSANVPEHLRAPDNSWFGLSVRARTIVYSSERIQPGELSSYAALADPKWKGRLCLRTSKKVYNQSLVAMMIARLGEEKTQQIVTGWVANLVAPPFSSDTKTMQAILAGQCDLGIVNTYYFGRLQKKDPSIKLALFWPNQQSSGVHINVSGAGITLHAKHRDAAVKLLEWLASPEAQARFAALNMEYPVNPAVQPDPVVTTWGEFKGDPLNVAEAGRLQVKAVMLMDRAGYR
ncbi:Fe(3+) ABC transporter substrate-binding protein [endosymbiont of Riftia pachyptila]|uniref:ABC-type Fe3+ transport system, periplasmic component n=1 Tax=endosymbiont of Riftia pachyptila (vent Ph05) TaxID=1048808 RepID=G2DEV5_9GAMM|nr:Fe(3+) ABC transporter substrate-binding protein [endosymbiont of Riftia pachyptila]EGV50862.1 ABC-type Fe3+ transport system, periplasmic component [endosymbiont of Riftia pachyptila (vent Ph05)]